MGKRGLILSSFLLASCLAFFALFFFDDSAKSGSYSQNNFVDLVSVQGASGPIYSSTHVMVAAGPDATTTATPFQPMPPTSTPARPMGWLSMADQPIIATPTIIPATPTLVKIPANPAVAASAAGRVNILLLGTDQRSDPGFRTDVIMLVSINPANNTVSVISFPRDLYITIPGWTEQRINTAFSSGGFNSIAATFQYNFHIQPQYYFLTNFQGFSQIIDDLNGIAVNASAPLQDKCDLPGNKHGYCTVEPGQAIMDGKTALWYVRSRHSTSDFDRTRRAQEVLYAMFTRMMKFDAITRIPALYSEYRDTVETNMTLTDMLPLLPVANAVRQDSSRIHRYAIGPGMVYDYVTPEGAMVLQPNYYAISNLINQALNGE